MRAHKNAALRWKKCWVMVMLAFVSSISYADVRSLGERRYEARDGGVDSAKPYPGSERWRDGDTSHTLSGKCILENAALPTLEVGCPSLSLVLLNASGKEIRKVLVQDGAFSVVVEKGKSYFLDLVNGRYALSGGKHGPLSAGDSLILKLRTR
jgi:hypothetical protein